MQSECRTDEFETKFWYQNGLLHRLDGPACERVDGTNEWFLYGELHRLDGPAIEYRNGDKYWYQNSKLHRLDGPAVEYADGYKSWYIDGKHHTFKQWLEYVWDSLSIEEQERYIFNGFEYAE